MLLKYPLPNPMTALQFSNVISSALACTCMGYILSQCLEIVFQLNLEETLKGHYREDGVVYLLRGN